MARTIECRCEVRFTCGYCLRNAPPWIFTPSSVMHPPSAVEDERAYRERTENPQADPEAAV